MAAFIATILGEALTLFFVFVLVLAIGRIPLLRRHPRAVHLIGVALTWIVAAAVAPTASSPPAAYIVTLAAIWSYRRDVHRPPSGWYRLAAAFAIVWCAVGLLLLWQVRSTFDPDDPSTLVPTGLFAVLGLLPWVLGWLVQGVRAAFTRSRAASTED
jgi:hypothetical protein